MDSLTDLRVLAGQLFKDSMDTKGEDQLTRMSRWVE